MTNLAASARTRAEAWAASATVHSRGSTWIKHQHPTESHKFLWAGHIGPIHYGASADQEIDTAWVDAHPIDDAPWLKKMVEADFNVYFGPGTSEFDAGQIIKYVDPSSSTNITFQPQQLQWTNDLDQIQAVGDPQSACPTITDDVLAFSGAFGTGLDFEWQVHGERLAKRLTLQAASAAGSPTSTIISGSNPVLRLQFIFQKSSGVEVWVDGDLWGEGNNTSASTVADIEFRSTATSAVLWYFMRPSVTDDDGLSSSAVMRVRKTGPNLFAEVRVPWAFLSSASYPVLVDPTVSYTMDSGSNDGDETDGVIDLVGTTIRMSTANADYAIHRFIDVDVPQGANILSVTSCPYISSGGPPYNDPDLAVYCESACDSASLTTASNDISDRARTSASVLWQENDVPAGDYYEMPSPSAAVQEVINLDGWAASNALSLIYVSQSASIVQFPTYENSPTRAHKLEISYSQTFSGSHVADARLEATASQVFDTWALLEVTASTLTASHIGDARLEATLTRTADTWAGLTGTLSQSHVSDGRLEATLTQDHVADATLQAQASQSHVSDSRLTATATQSHVSDARLTTTVTRSHAADARLLATVAQTHISDARLEATQAVDHAADSVLTLQATQSHIGDTRLLATQSATFAAWATLEATLTQDHASDAVLVLQSVLDHVGDARLLATQAATTVTFAVLEALAQTAIHVAWSRLVLLSTLTHISDTRLQAVQAATFTADARLEALAQTTTHVADAILEAQAVSLAHAADGRLGATLAPTHAADGRLEAQAVSLSHISDARLQVQASPTHAADAVLARTQTATATAYTVLEALAQATTFTADGRLQATQLAAHATDAFVVAITLTADHQADAVLTRTQTVGHAATVQLTPLTFVLHTADLLGEFDTILDLRGALILNLPLRGEFEPIVTLRGEFEPDIALAGKT